MQQILVICLQGQQPANNLSNATSGINSWWYNPNGNF